MDVSNITTTSLASRETKRVGYTDVCVCERHDIRSWKGVKKIFSGVNQ